MEDLNVQTIAIPVEEYKELLQKQAELSLIYHKGAGGSVYDIGNFVLDLMLAVHPELITKQEDTDAEYGLYTVQIPEPADCGLVR